MFRGLGHSASKHRSFGTIFDSISRFLEDFPIFAQTLREESAPDVNIKVYNLVPVATGCHQIWPNVYVLLRKNGIFRTFLIAKNKEISDFNILQLKHDDIF